MTPARRKAQGWPARLADTDGLRVRTRHKMTTGEMVIPAGTEGVVRVYHQVWSKLRFVGPPCSCCKIQPIVGGLSPHDLEPIQAD